MSSFAQRALVTFILGPVALFVIYYGGWVYFVPVALILSIATFEYVRMVQHLSWRPPLWLILPAAFLLWIDAQWSAIDLQAPILLTALFLATLYALWEYEIKDRENVSATWFVTLSGIILLGWLASHFFSLRNLEAERLFGWTALAMVATWGTDSFAYLVGRKIGRTKMSPRLSPNKSVEGYIAGVVLGTGITVLFALLFQIEAIGMAALLGLIISIISPAGDLAMSLLKRETGVKDTGAIFPGHGGALDRIDSLIWSVAIAYYLILYLPFQ